MSTTDGNSPVGASDAPDSLPDDILRDSEDQRSHLQWLVERYGYARRDGHRGNQPSAVWMTKALQAADRLVIDELTEICHGGRGSAAQIAKARIAIIEGWIADRVAADA